MRRRPDPRLLAVVFALSVGAACVRGEADKAADWRPERPPGRIVAGSILAAEVLLEIAPLERIAGVHTLAADPRFSLVAEAATRLPQVGSEPELLLSVHPDLVITDAFTRPETQALLRAAGVPVLRTATPHDFDDIARNIRSIGRACHLDAAAEALVARMQARLEAVRRRGADLGVWSLCSLDGGLHTYGGGSLFDAMLRAVGARNLAAERGAGPFRKLSLEAVLAWRPDAFVVDDDRSQDGRPQWLGQVGGLQLLPCVQKDHLVFVPGPLLGTTSHHLVETAEFVQAALRTWGRP